MLSISLNLKQGIDRLKINKWLMGLLVAIPIAGIGSYVAYNQLVTVPPPAEGAKQDSDSISHAGKSDDLGVSEWHCATRKFGQCQSQNLWCLKAVAG